MPKKSKPKPRTNWKQRALHCEEVIKIQNVLAEKREERVKELETERDHTVAEIGKVLELMRSDSGLSSKSYLGDIAADQMGLRDESELLDLDANRLLNAIFEEPPNHWQRFKSWLSRRGK